MFRIPPMEAEKLTAMTEQNGGELLQYVNLGSEPPQGDGKPEARPRREGRISQILLHTKTVTDSDGQRYLIILSSLITPVNATVNTLRVQLAFITLAMVLVSIIIALVMSSWVSRPIISICLGAKKLSMGDYGVKFHGDGYGEIKELSDILNHTAKELSKVEALRRELIANISHDLRTPLTLIEGYAEAMRDLPGEMSPENAQIIIDEAKRLNRLVNDVLDLSKLQTGAEVIEADIYDLTESVENVVTRFNSLIKPEGYTIEFTKEEDAFVYADEDKITQVIYNLLSNAVQYTGENKLVYVSQRVLANSVKIEVTDTGKGIAPEDLPHIWERYYRSQNNHKRDIAGTGIGLSLVKSIFENHNAQYGVDTSEKGSTFWFVLPLQNKS